MTGKPNRAERVIAFLEARYPGWVPAIELEPVGGRQGWRTAVSQARKLLRQREGRWNEDDDPIPNRLTYIPKHADNCSAILAWDIPGACNCGKREYWTLSEYRLKKASESLVPSGEMRGQTTTTTEDFTRTGELDVMPAPQHAPTDGGRA